MAYDCKYWARPFVHKLLKFILRFFKPNSSCRIINISSSLGVLSSVSNDELREKFASAYLMESELMDILKIYITYVKVSPTSLNLSCKILDHECMIKSHEVSNQTNFYIVDEYKNNSFSIVRLYWVIFSVFIKWCQER